jgi:hypothetical protein
MRLLCKGNFFKLKGNTMKFLTKLSALSLLVLMFSFMNMAHANTACVGQAVPDCKSLQTQAACESSYNNTPQAKLCKWHMDEIVKSSSGKPTLVRAGCAEDAECTEATYPKACKSNADCSTKGAVCIKGYCSK